MSFPNPSTAIAETVVDELVRGGVRSVVVSPGSRSTALVLAFSRHAHVETFVNLDERSAAFRALGMAVATGRPTVVLTTSGSAVANLLPAIVEAERSQVPLVALTADRPSVLIARRANQTMDHLAALGGSVRAQVSLGPAVVAIDGNSEWREGISNALSVAMGGESPPGPIHINVAFEEPTMPVGDDGRAHADEYPFDCRGADGEAPWTARVPYQTPVPDLPDLGHRTLVVVGRGDFDREDLASWARRADSAVLATALSGVRGPGVVSGYHHILAGGLPPTLQPSCVVVVGDLNPADRIHQFIPEGVPVIHVDRWGIVSDPMGKVTVAVRDDPISFLEGISSQQDQWKESWLDMDLAVQTGVSNFLDEADRLSGPVLARALNGAEWDVLAAGSSLAVRDIDNHVTKPGRVLSNRGVSGIDGFVSTTLGIGAVYPRTVGYVGDLSFLHDANGFLGDQVPPVVFLVVDNDGGGLFDSLPQSTLGRDFERFFITPPNRDISLLARFHGLAFDVLSSAVELRAAVDAGFARAVPTVIRAKVDRAHDVKVRAEIARLAAGVVSRF